MTEDQVERIRRRLSEGLADHGVRKVVCGGAFPKPGGWSLLFITETDEQFARLTKFDPFLPEVLEILRGCGVAEPQLSWISTSADSQETLDRDYGGHLYNRRR